MFAAAADAMDVCAQAYGKVNRMGVVVVVVSTSRIHVIAESSRDERGRIGGNKFS